MCWGAVAHAYEKDKVYKFTVVHFADTHGHFWPDSIGQGGFAHMATVIQQIRANHPNTLLLMAGDFNTGQPASDILLAEPDIQAFNYLKVDAVTAGNHEFDLSLKDMRQQQKLLKAPLLSANAKLVDADGVYQDFFKPYTTLERGGLKFLIVGLSNPSTSWQANPLTTRHFDFLDPYESLVQTVEEASEKEGPFDVKISLNHLGFWPLGDHSDMHYGDFTLAQMLPTGYLDLLVTSNSHNFSCVNQFGLGVVYTPGGACSVPYSNLMPIVAAFRNSLYLGQADFEFKNGKTTLVDYKIIPINVKRQLPNGQYALYTDYIPADPQLEKLLKNYRDLAYKSLNAPVGKFTRDLFPNRKSDNRLATLVARSRMDYVKADVAIVNAGAIRGGFAQGTVSFSDVLRVDPYGNTITTVELSGEDLFSYIEQVYLYQHARRPFYAGVTFDVSNYQITNMKVGGKPIDFKQKYKLALSSYLANGGDHYPVLVEHPTFVDSEVVEYQGMVQYLKRFPKIDVDKLPVDGPRWLDGEGQPEPKE